MGEILQFIGEAIAGLLVFAVIAVVVIWLFIMWLNDWETPSSRRRQQQVIDDEPDYRTMTLKRPTTSSSKSARRATTRTTHTSRPSSITPRTWCAKPREPEHNHAPEARYAAFLLCFTGRPVVRCGRWE